MTTTNFRIEVNPKTWEVGRWGGWIKSSHKDWIRFATIERLDTGCYLIKHDDTRFLEAMQTLRYWDGSGPLGGPVVRSLLEANRIATETVAFMLELAWAKDKAVQGVRRKHGAKT